MSRIIVIVIIVAVICNNTCSKPIENAEIVFPDDERIQADYRETTPNTVNARNSFRTSNVQVHNEDPVHFQSGSYDAFNNTNDRRLYRPVTVLTDNRHNVKDKKKSSRAYDYSAVIVFPSDDNETTTSDDSKMPGNYDVKTIETGTGEEPMQIGTRSFIGVNSCPEDYVWFKDKCVSSWDD